MVNESLTKLIIPSAMQIYSRSNNLDHAPRSYGSDRKSAESEANGDAAISRREDAITGSKAVLSNSLADALWAIQPTSAPEDEPVRGTIEDIYLSFAA
ncbi:MAG: hypothetical protein JWM58_3236 [Rhizobium sp.]|nr:hypothetical protein [Rhizobium sp.]